MPILIYLKQSNVPLAIKLNMQQVQKDVKKGEFVGGKILLVKTITDRAVAIPIDNIAYIQEITDEDVKKHEEEIKRRHEASRITKPTMVIPNLKKRRN